MEKDRRNKPKNVSECGAYFYQEEERMYVGAVYGEAGKLYFTGVLVKDGSNFANAVERMTGEWKGSLSAK